MADAIQVLEIRIHEATNYLEACHSMLTDNSRDQWQNILNSYQINKDKIRECLHLDLKYEKQIYDMERDLTGFISKLIGIKHKVTLFHKGKSESMEKVVSGITTEWQTFLLGFNSTGTKTAGDLFLEGIQMLLIDELEIGKRHLEESFRLGNKYAGFKLAEMCKNKKDSEFYLREIEHPKALYQLGILAVENGLTSNAIEYWQQAQDMIINSKKPMKTLSMNLVLKLIENSTDFDQNSPELEMLFKNVAQKHPESTNYLGYLYYTGDKVEKDYARAVEYFKLGAELGCTESWNNLGICYEKGQGVEVSNSKAKESYERIASIHAEACCNLGSQTLIQGIYYTKIQSSANLYST